MNAPTDTIPAPRSAREGSLSGWRSPRARISYNVLRVIIGASVLSCIHYAGPLALMGLLPLAWGTAGLWWIYHRQRSTRN
jgi:hypothetical protein